MNLPLDPRQQKRLEKIARQTGKSPEVLALEIVNEGLAARGKSAELQAAEETAAAERQRKAWERFLTRIDALPEVKPTDALCWSRDHDKILYGQKKL